MTGEYFKTLRKKAGYTQRSLAMACAMNIRHVQKIESGEYQLAQIELRTAYKISKALYVSMEELYLDDPEKEN